MWRRHTEAVRKDGGVEQKLFRLCRRRHIMKTRKGNVPMWGIAFLHIYLLMVRLLRARG